MPHRILLADDSLTIQKVVELTFSDAEFEIRAVGNGDDAVRALDEFRPDIVLADAFMPGLTGYDVCERVKARGSFPPVPVVLLAGTFEPFDRARAERSGADSIVTKPFDSHALASLVRDLVEKAQRQAPAEPPAPAVPESASAARWDEPTAPDVPALGASPVPETPGEAAYATAAIPVGQILAAVPPPAPATFELADPFGDEPGRESAPPSVEPIDLALALAPPAEAPGVPATTLPLQVDEHLAAEAAPETEGDRADAITGPIVIEQPVPPAEAPVPVEAVPARVEDPFGPPPVMQPQDDFLVEPAGVQPRDIEADLEAFESSGKGRTRPEVWDQAEAMGLTGPRDETSWPAEPGVVDLPEHGRPEASTPETIDAAAHEGEHQLAPDAGAFDLAEAEGVAHRDLEALAAEARRTDLNELIPARRSPASEESSPSLSAVAAVAAVAVVPAVPVLAADSPLSSAGPVSLTDADVDRIARRVAELVGESSLRDVAWEVVPEIAERVVRQRIRELEGE